MNKALLVLLTSNKAFQPGSLVTTGKRDVWKLSVLLFKGDFLQNSLDATFLLLILKFNYSSMAGSFPGEENLGSSQTLQRVVSWFRCQGWSSQAPGSAVFSRGCLGGPGCAFPLQGEAREVGGSVCRAQFCAPGCPGGFP